MCGGQAGFEVDHLGQEKQTLIDVLALTDAIRHHTLPILGLVCKCGQSLTISLLVLMDACLFAACQIHKVEDGGAVLLSF